jgi:hypothetical protein
VRYTIHRMCEIPGNPGNICYTAGGSRPKAFRTGSRARRLAPALIPTGATTLTPTNPYYRITVMVSGPRGTATYAQAVIY